VKLRKQDMLASDNVPTMILLETQSLQLY